MKFRHVAALALVGWYLMLPPLNRNLPDGVDTDAPLRNWFIAGSFDRADSCSLSQGDLASRAKAEGKTEQENRILLGACIATDDPRLAK